jgi:hypothetical protein
MLLGVTTTQSPAIKMEPSPTSLMEMFFTADILAIDAPSPFRREWNQRSDNKRFRRRVEDRGQNDFFRIAYQYDRGAGYPDNSDCANGQLFVFNMKVHVLPSPLFFF